jgi:pSer/pThr/pTyr-binding forkhead associated (FHA) protein
MISTGIKQPSTTLPKTYIKRNPNAQPPVGNPTGPVATAQAASDQAQISSPPVFLKLGEQIVRLPQDGQAAQFGRTEDSPIKFKSSLVSRRHAEFRANNGTLEVRDLNSSNGTFVGDKKIEPGKWHRVQDGQKMNLAGVPLEWRDTAVDASKDKSFALEDATGKKTSVPENSGEGLTVGRLDGNGLQLRKGDVSRKHAQIYETKDGLLVQDLGSKFGTTINDEKLEPGQWTLAQPGAQVNVASVPFTVAEQAAQGTQVAGAAIGGPVGVALTLAGLKTFAAKGELESKSTLLSALGEAKSTMSKESGILELPKGVPTMVIPDIHGQREYLTRALEHEIDGKPVMDHLKEGKMNLLCLGDGMHGEGRAKGRWLQAEKDFFDGQPSRAMYDEMVESMGTMKMVMDLKAGLGENFAYLRGNHDDINPERGYMKYTRVGESSLVKDWVTKNYGEDLLQEWHGFEKSMPLVAKGSGFVASHAAPGGVLDRNEVESKTTGAFYKLAWTENRGWAEEGRERQNFETNLDVVGADPGDKWFVGHRKVENANYRTQFDDQLVQVNPLDSDGFVVAMIGADGSHDPEKDTFKV